MPRSELAAWLRRGVSVIAASGLLCGCAPGAFTTQSQRIGLRRWHRFLPAAACGPGFHRQLFGAAILQGAAIGAGTGALAGGLIGGLATGNWRGAAFGALAGGVTGGVIGGSNAYWHSLQQQRMDQASLYSRVSLDLERENVQIDKTQLAFDQLVDCRFRQAQAINNDYRTHRIDRATAEAAMALVRQRAARDLQVAQIINQQIQDRGQQFGVATGNIDPSAAAAINARPQAAQQPAVVRTAAPIKLRPDPGAPDIAQLQAHDQVTVSPGRNGYALVETSSGARGYVSASDLQGSGGNRSISVPPPPRSPPRAMSARLPAAMPRGATTSPRAWL